MNLNNYYIFAVTDDAESKFSSGSISLSDLKLAGLMKSDSGHKIQGVKKVIDGFGREVQIGRRLDLDFNFVSFSMPFSDDQIVCFCLVPCSVSTPNGIFDTMLNDVSFNPSAFPFSFTAFAPVRIALPEDTKYGTNKLQTFKVSGSRIAENLAALKKVISPSVGWEGAYSSYPTDKNGIVQVKLVLDDSFVFWLTLPSSQVSFVGGVLSVSSSAPDGVELANNDVIRIFFLSL